MIRLWQLGDSEKNILPTQEGVDRLEKKLKQAHYGETVDIIWDPMLRVTIITDDGQIIEQVQ